jgi:hypothetical protein
MKEIEILNFKDFEKFKSSYLKEKREGTLDTDVLPTDEIVACCLRLMFLLNIHRNKVNEEQISHVARFLDMNMETDFNFKFGYSNHCPYKRDYCDMSCGPSEYANCNADAPVEYLYQDFKTVDMKIKEEAMKKNINIEDYIFHFIVQNICNIIYDYRVDIKQNIQELLLAIWNGKKNYEISVNYKDGPDHFINLLQEMIRKGYEDINYYMLLGKNYNPDDSIEAQRQYIKDQLEILRDKFSLIPKISSLHVNSKYPIKSIVMELLSTSLSFSNGQKFADKIDLLESSSFSDGLIKVFFPRERGFIDWNTFQSVLRINQNLRPNEPSMQKTIDRVFMEDLIQNYVKSICI